MIPLNPNQLEQLADVANEHLRTAYRLYGFPADTVPELTPGMCLAVLEASAEPHPSRELSPHDRAVSSELTRHIRMVLQQLTLGQAMAVALDLDGYTRQEAAQWMQTTEGAAAAVLHRGRVNLRELLHYIR